METTVKVPIWKTKYFALIPKIMVDDVKSKHLNKSISVHFKTNFKLKNLSDDESVCWGDGESFCFILKKIN